MAKKPNIQTQLNQVLSFAQAAGVTEAKIGNTMKGVPFIWIPGNVRVVYFYRKENFRVFFPDGTGPQKRDQGKMDFGSARDAATFAVNFGRPSTDRLVIP